MANSMDAELETRMTRQYARANQRLEAMPNSDLCETLNAHLCDLDAGDVLQLLLNTAEGLLAGPDYRLQIRNFIAETWGKNPHLDDFKFEHEAEL